MSSTKFTPLQESHDYFGFAWQLTVSNTDSSGNPFGTAIEISSDQSDPGTGIRVVFHTSFVALQSYSWCDLEIYNLNEVTEQAILKQGAAVTLSAGFKKNFNGQNSVIWQGRVLQPTWERPDAITYIVKLHCLAGMMEGVMNFTSFTQGPLLSQAQTVRNMAAQAHTHNAIQIGDISALENAPGGQLPRSSTYFGRPDEHIADIAENAGLTSYFSGTTGLMIRTLAPPSANTEAKFIYGPPFPPGTPVTLSSAQLKLYTPTLKGTPQQTQDGVSFSVGMDSRPQVSDIVELDLTAVRLLPVYPGTKQTALDVGGRYVITGISHEGDSYGGIWETKIDAVSLNFWPSWIGRTQNQTNSTSGATP